MDEMEFLVAFLPEKDRKMLPLAGEANPQEFLSSRGFLWMCLHGHTDKMERFRDWAIDTLMTCVMDGAYLPMEAQPEHVRTIREFLASAMGGKKGGE